MTKFCFQAVLDYFISPHILGTLAIISCRRVCWGFLPSTRQHHHMAIFQAVLRKRSLAGKKTSANRPSKFCCNIKAGAG